MGHPRWRRPRDSVFPWARLSSRAQGRALRDACPLHIFYNHQRFLLIFFQTLSLTQLAVRTQTDKGIGGVLQRPSRGRTRRDSPSSTARSLPPSLSAAGTLPTHAPPRDERCRVGHPGIPVSCVAGRGERERGEREIERKSCWPLGSANSPTTLAHELSCFPPRLVVCRSTRDGQTSSHRPRLVVSRSTCPQLSPPPLTQTALY